MTCYVIPASLDQGRLGQKIEANTPEDAARIARSTTLSEHADEALIVRWEVRHNAKGQVVFSRVTEVAPAGQAPKSEAKAEAPKEAEPAKEAPKAEAAKDEPKGEPAKDAPKADSGKK